MEEEPQFLHATEGGPPWFLRHRIPGLLVSSISFEVFGFGDVCALVSFAWSVLVRDITVSLSLVLLSLSCRALGDYMCGVGLQTVVLEA